MAVEARHLNLFPPQLIGNREMMNTIDGNTNMYNSSSNQMGYGVVPLSGTITADTLLPAYNNSVINDSNSFPPKTTTTTTAMKSDSGLTYNFPTLSRKRSRDSSSINPFLSSYQTPTNNKNCGASFSFLGEDISLQIQQHQFDIDRLISHHMEKVRLEIEEKRKRQARKILEAIELGMMKRLRAKEEEIEKMGKLNWALEEKVKSLCIENQIWRDLAQTNEATANALRTNLEQVLAQVKEDHRTQEEETQAAGLAALMDDAQSCCGSSGGELHEDDGEVNFMDGWRSIGDRKVGVQQVKNDGGEEEGTSGRCSTKSKSNKMVNSINGGKSGNSRRWCRNCGKEESCVLILPCRHLCLCTVCGSSLHTCPICKTPKNASLHVNMS